MTLRFLVALAIAACGGPPSAREVGTGSAAPAPAPAVTPKVRTFALPTRGVISAGSRHVCARTADGHVACWGQLAPPRTIMAGSYFAPQLNPSVPQIVAGLDHVLGVVAGDSIRCAWTDRGEVWCWGWTSTTTERAPERIDQLTDIVEVAGGDLDGIFCARTRRGTVACWGDPASTIHTIPGLEDADEIAVASVHACARRVTGDVVCWSGANPDKLTSIPEAAGSISLAATMRLVGSFAALLSDGRVVEFARPSGTVMRGPLVAGGRSITVGAETCVLGTGVTCWTADKPTPTLVPDLDGATHISAGGDVTCARLATGRAQCWGAPGIRGDGSTSVALEPIEVAGLTGVQQLAVSDFTSCARLATGRVACWGHRFQDAKGAGNVATDDATPVELPGLTNAIDIRLDNSSGCARLADKRTACWGWDQGPGGRMLRTPTIIPRLANLGPLFEGPCGMRGNELVCLAADPRLAVAPRWERLAGKQRFWHGGFARNSWTCARATSGMNCLYVHSGRSYTDIYPEQGFEVTPDAIDIAQVSGLGGMCILHATGSVTCAHNSATPDEVVTNARALTRGPNNGLCALIKDGTVTCWDENLRGTQHAWGPVITPKLSDAVEVAGGGNHACARRTTGTVACWGDWRFLGINHPATGRGEVKGSF